MPTAARSTLAWRTRRTDSGRDQRQESYLLSERILEMARATGAEAIHPATASFRERRVRRSVSGSRAGLGRAVARRDGLPATRPPRARWQRSTGVPIVPGYDGSDQDDETLTAEAAADRVPAAGEGGGGRRRTRHARRPRRGQLPRRWRALDARPLAAFGQDDT